MCGAILPLSSLPRPYRLRDTPKPPIQWLRSADFPPYSVEFKNEWSFTATPPYVSVAWCFVKETILRALHHGVKVPVLN
jgi:hypothetical protein